MVCIVYVIIFILIFCYHKDIATAMDTAAYEETLKKTKAKTRENTIRGGSHYGWAACGTVKGDGQAEITPALQQVLTAQLIRQTLIRE